MGQLQHLVVNLGTEAVVRHETLEGRPHLVVPMVMITEGVHAGSNGPLFYPAEELESASRVWNHKPIVVYHPEINGQGVSACDPTIMNSRKVGVVLNTAFDKTTKKLRAEAWLDKSRMGTVDARIQGFIDANKMMEVSTGLFTENEGPPGEWNGEKYDAIAKRHQPDHLALLPDRVGACSIKDGAGLLRLNESSTVNGLSFDNIRDQLRRILRESLPDYPYILDVYATFVVYEQEVGEQYKLWKQGYTVAGNLVSLTGTPEEVIRVTEYRTLSGAFVGNAAPNAVSAREKEAKHMDKKTLVDQLIANAASGWTEEDRTGLMEFAEPLLERLVKNSTTNPPKADPPPASVAPLAKAADPIPAQNMTPEQYIDTQVPEAMRGMFRSGLIAHNARKAELIATITANKANRFAADALQTKELPELEAIAALAKVAPAPVGNYAGAVGAPVANAGAPEGLGLPSMSFGK